MTPRRHKLSVWLAFWTFYIIFHLLFQCTGVSLLIGYTYFMHDQRLFQPAFYLSSHLAQYFYAAYCGWLPFTFFSIRWRLLTKTPRLGKLLVEDPVLVLIYLCLTFLTATKRYPVVMIYTTLLCPVPVCSYQSIVLRFCIWLYKPVCFHFSFPPGFDCMSGGSTVLWKFLFFLYW